MKPEIEAKFLNADHTVLRAQLQSIGAELLHPMRLMRRVNMDFSDGALQARNGWLRIRDEGGRVTLTYKQLHSWTVDGVKEVETVVADFEDTKQIFESIGLQVKSSQESRRETWQLDGKGGVEVVLDQWPFTRSYCELEGGSEADLQAAATRLCLAWKDAVFGSVEPVYRAEYDITDQEFYTLTDLKFENKLPELLSARRRL